MIETIYKDPDCPDVTITTVTLGKGDVHKMWNFVSYNAGHVFAVESEVDGLNWHEYVLDDSRFHDWVDRIKGKGWVAQ